MKGGSVGVPLMKSVVSSNVAAVGYDEPSRALYVEFRNGALYRCDGDSEEVIQAFLAAPSKGRFVWQRVRDRYSYRRIR